MPTKVKKKGHPRLSRPLLENDDGSDPSTKRSSPRDISTGSSTGTSAIDQDDDDLSRSASYDFVAQKKVMTLGRGNRPKSASIDSRGRMASVASRASVVAKSERGLLFSFLAMVIVGLGNKLFQIFETIPMHNYPYFLSLMTTFIYIPLSFAYIIPMQMMGKISHVYYYQQVI